MSKLLGRVWYAIDVHRHLVKNVLVEISHDLTEITVPDVVGIPGEVGLWPVYVVVVSPASLAEDDFQSKLPVICEE